MLRIVVGTLITAHGIGHLLFLMPLLGISVEGQYTRSWLLNDDSAARVIGSIIWIATIVGFGAAVYGLWDHQAWWRDAAVIASVISAVGLILFWANPVSSPVVSAMIFNAVVLVALLVLHMPTTEAIGA